MSSPPFPETEGGSIQARAMRSCAAMIALPPDTAARLEGEAIRCPCHGSLFSLVDGAVLEGPARDPIAVATASVTAVGRLIADISTLHA